MGKIFDISKDWGLGLLAHILGNPDRYMSSTSECTINPIESPGFTSEIYWIVLLQLTDITRMLRGTMSAHPYCYRVSYAVHNYMIQWKPLQVHPPS